MQVAPLLLFNTLLLQLNRYLAGTPTRKKLVLFFIMQFDFQP